MLPGNATPGREGDIRRFVILCIAAYVVLVVAVAGFTAPGALHAAMLRPDPTMHASVGDLLDHCDRLFPTDAEGCGNLRAILPTVVAKQVLKGVLKALLIPTAVFVA